MNEHTDNEILSLLSAGQRWTVSVIVGLVKNVLNPVEQFLSKSYYRVIPAHYKSSKHSCSEKASQEVLKIAIAGNTKSPECKCLFLLLTRSLLEMKLK